MKISKLKSRLFVSTLLISAVTLFAPEVSADDVKIDYRQHAIESEVAKRYWADSLEQATLSFEGNTVPVVFVGEFDRGEETLTVTMLAAESVCAHTTCPVRIFKGDEMLRELNFTDNVEFHAASPTGYFISDGPSVFSTTKKP